MRLDPRIQRKDVLARMLKDNRPTANGLNMRLKRWRERNGLIPWRQGAITNDVSKRDAFLATYSAAQRAANSRLGMPFTSFETVPTPGRASGGSSTGNALPPAATTASMQTVSEQDTVAAATDLIPSTRKNKRARSNKTVKARSSIDSRNDIESRAATPVPINESSSKTFDLTSSLLSLASDAPSEEATSPYLNASLPPNTPHEESFPQITTKELFPAGNGRNMAKTSRHQKRKNTSVPALCNTRKRLATEKSKMYRDASTQAGNESPCGKDFEKDVTDSAEREEVSYAHFSVPDQMGPTTGKRKTDKEMNGMQRRRASIPRRMFQLC